MGISVKKIVALGLTGAMVLGLTGCGGNAGSGTGAAAGQAPAETAKQAAGPEGQAAGAEGQAGSAEQGQGAASGEAQYVLKLCTEQTDGDPIDDGCDKWAELVEKATGGAVKIEVYPSSQLGAKADLIEMAMMGQNICTIADGSYLMDYVPDFGVVMGPYLFPDWEDMYKITASGWWSNQEAALQEKGLKIISTNWIYGERQLMTKTPVHSLADMKGKKIRVPNNDISIAMFNMLGSAATPMALSEVYTSLSQGVVDGVENPLTTLYNNAFQEVCKNVTMTNHQMTFSNFIVGDGYWNTIPEEYQNAIIECGKEAAEYNNGLYKELSEKMVAELKAAGCTVTELDGATYEEFRNACVALYEQYEADGTWSKGLYEEIQGIIAE